jgi:hypothetical protein
MVAKVSNVWCILGAISTYKLHLGCSLARWTRMDESYNTMALDADFQLMKKFTFSTPQIAKSGAYSSSILYPLCSPCICLSKIIHNTYTLVKGKKN